ncbi:DNA repair protein RecO [Flavobacterium sp.]|uniref:DNA repair protein RecO n=1 Tax=Flavobacterium sp. TaxID=239 RepID=UPI00286D136B|nr:DNA repair protein RecO [Flavobacterium sp.]
MLVKTKAIVISSVKYQEKSLIVRCYTLSDGLKSYFVQNPFSNRKSNQKIAYFQPLTLLEIEGVHKNKGTLEYFKEIKLSTSFKSINTNIFKSSIALFLAEILQNCIHEQEQDENLFNYVETALIWLDNHDEIANFHIIFLLEITKYLGFYPDISEINLPFFDLSEGIFTAHQGINSLSEQETSVFKKLLLLKFEDNQKNILLIERQLLLKIVLNYYFSHIQGFKMPKSLEILTEIHH